MIDYFALALTHALILIALLRVLVRPDLDREDLAEEDAELPQAQDKRSARAARRARRAGKHRGASDA